MKYMFLFKKANQRGLMIFRDFYFKWRYFSLSFAIYSTLWWFGWYIKPLRVICMWGHKKKTLYLNKYFLTNYYDLIRKYKIVNYDINKFEKINTFPIWVFWAQGIENAPDLVRSCYYRLVNCNNGSVNLITMKNVKDFVDIPYYIYQKVFEGNISLTHFSDILRVSLLAEHGGFWVDATCWVSNGLPEQVKSLPFYTSCSKNVPKLPLWSDSRWCGWGMSTNVTNCPLFLFLRDMLFIYHKNENYLIDYLLIDYLIFLGYNEIQIVKNMIDNVPENNLKRNNLHFLLNKRFKQRFYDELSPTWLFKLSYKTPWAEYTPDGEKTFYHYLKLGKLGNESTN